MSLREQSFGNRSFGTRDALTGALRIVRIRPTRLAVENGQYAPTFDLACRFARPFAVPLDQAFTCHDD